MKKFYVNPMDYAKLHTFTDKELTHILDSMFMRDYRNRIVLRNEPDYVIAPRLMVPEMRVLKKIVPQEWKKGDQYV